MRKTSWCLLRAVVPLALVLTVIPASPEQVPPGGPQSSPAGCREPSTELSFESLVQGASVGAGPEAPAVFLASAPEDLASFVHYLDAQHQQVLAKVDFAAYVVLAVFGGPKEGGYYTLTAQRVSVQAGQLWVVAGSQSRELPGPGPANAYHMLAVPRAEFGDSVPSSWVLLDDRGQIVATAGVPSGGLVFQSLGQGAPVASEPKTPAAHLAVRKDDFAVFERFLDPEHQKALARVDLSSQVVVAVFRGAVGTSGSSVTVQRVSQETGRLRIVVRLEDPAPGSFVLPAFTSPYHVVLVQRGALGPSVPSSWTLVDSQGRTLAQHP